MPVGAALLCLVIGISDGDTLTARCETPAGLEEYQNIKVRLAEIDAPEKGQPFGTRSRQHLADLCFQKPSTVTPRTKDRYFRTVATVACEGVDAGAEQVRAGMAWVFAWYVTDRSLYLVSVRRWHLAARRRRRVMSGRWRPEMRQQFFDAAIRVRG